MKEILNRPKAPECEELDRKLSELDNLEQLLASRELEWITLQAELHAFERQYLWAVGTRLAQLDEIHAQLASLQAELNPEDETAATNATQTRAKAQRSRDAIDDKDLTSDVQPTMPPTENLRSLYIKLAKRVHPDLATDEQQRKQRHMFMAAANVAYEAGDVERLESLLREWEDSPDSVEGDDVATALVRTIRRLAQVKQRLNDLENEIAAAKQSDTFLLMLRVSVEAERGSDLLHEMANLLDLQIAKASNRIACLKGQE